MPVTGRNLSPAPQSKENKFIWILKDKLNISACHWISSRLLQPAAVEPAWIPSLQEGHSISPPQEVAAISWWGHSPACSSVLMKVMKAGLSFRAEDPKLINSMRRSAGAAQGRGELSQGLSQPAESGSSSPAAYEGPDLQLGQQMSSVHQPSFVHP